MKTLFSLTPMAVLAISSMGSAKGCYDHTPATGDDTGSPVEQGPSKQVPGNLTGQPSDASLATNPNADKKTTVAPLRRLFQYRENLDGLSQKTILAFEELRSDKSVAPEPRIVMLDNSAVRDGRFQIVMPDGRTIVMRLMKNEKITGLFTLQAEDYHCWGGASVDQGELEFISFSCFKYGNLRIIRTPDYEKGTYILYENKPLQPKDPPNRPNNSDRNTGESYLERDNIYMADEGKVSSAPAPVQTQQIRVAFFLTPKAKSELMTRFNSSNLIKIIAADVSDTNSAFASSLVPIEWVIAYIGEIPYTETTWGKDLERFVGNDDGYMEVAHDLRGRYDADVAVLVTARKDLCGEARSIGTTNAKKAFVVLSFDCIQYELSMAHEVGHLHGCRHNKAEDPAVVPYKYGHGYLWQASDGTRYRSIMSYDRKPGYEFAPQFSSPTAKYRDPNTGIESTTGEAIWADNARVLRETAPTVAAFETEQSIVALPQETIASGHYADAIGLDALSNAAAYTIEPDAKVSFRSKKTITLKKGFWAKKGSHFAASRIM